MPFVSGGGGSGSGAISGVTVTGTAASGQVPVASSSSAGAWSYPPGFEIAYAQITADANITDTSEATATSLIAIGSTAFDGTAVYAEFFTPSLISPTGAAVTVTLFEGSTEIGRMGEFFGVGATQITGPVVCRLKFTPSAASHTYKICGFVSTTTGTPRISAGAGGTSVFIPAYLRFVKA